MCPLDIFSTGRTVLLVGSKRCKKAIGKLEQFFNLSMVYLKKFNVHEIFGMVLSTLFPNWLNVSKNYQFLLLIEIASDLSLRDGTY